MSSNPKAHTCHMAVRHCLPCAGSVGASDGANVVVAIAALLVDSDGVSDGVRDGDGDVSPVGARLELEAIDDGAADGTELGMPVGSAVGASEGVPVGDMLGAMVGGIDGAAVGRREVGSSEGEAEGSADGGALGALVDGDGVGENVGVLEGCDVGLRVGSAVGLHARIRRANRRANSALIPLHVNPMLLGHVWAGVTAQPIGWAHAQHVHQQQCPHRPSIPLQIEKADPPRTYYTWLTPQSRQSCRVNSRRPRW